jgi:hypothetical protein
MRSVANLEGFLSKMLYLFASVAVEFLDFLIESVELDLVHRSPTIIELLIDPAAESLEVASLHKFSAAFSPIKFVDITLEVAKLEGSGRLGLAAFVAVVVTGNKTIEAAELTLGHELICLLELLIDPPIESLEVASLYKSSAAFSPFTFGDRASPRVVAKLEGFFFSD